MIDAFVPQSHLPEIQAIRLKTKSLGKSPAAVRTALYVLHCCYLGLYTKDLEWTPIYSQILANVAGGGKRAALVTRRLSEEGFLECDGISILKTKCYGYRLGPKLALAAWARESKTKPVSPETERLLDAAADSDDWSLAQIAINLPTDTRQTIKGLDLDKGTAEEILRRIAPERNWSQRRLQAWIWRIQRFSTAFTKGTTGRIYTDANMLPKEVREAIRIDGEPTVELDLSNCQPLLLTLLLPDTEERKKWQALTESGIIYEEFGKTVALSRKEAKNDQFVPFLFGADRPLVRAYFQREFPIALTVIDEANKNAKQSRRKGFKNTNEGLAHTLQRSESAIIVEHVCTAFTAVSIHDGVRVKASEAEMVNAYIQHVFQRLHGLRPKLKIGKEDARIYQFAELAKFSFSQSPTDSLAA